MREVWPVDERLGFCGQCLGHGRPPFPRHGVDGPRRHPVSPTVLESIHRRLAMTNTATVPTGTLAHATPATAPFVQGRRTFLKYQDLGVTAASSGRMRAQVMSATEGMTRPAGTIRLRRQFVVLGIRWIDSRTARLRPITAGLFSPAAPQQTATSDCSDLQVSYPPTWARCRARRRRRGGRPRRVKGVGRRRRIAYQIRRLWGVPVSRSAPSRRGRLLRWTRAALGPVFGGHQDAAAGRQDAAHSAAGAVCARARSGAWMPKRGNHPGHLRHFA
jgi:hypothetical protein